MRFPRHFPIVLLAASAAWPHPTRLGDREPRPHEAFRPHGSSPDVGARILVEQAGDIEGSRPSLPARSGSPPTKTAEGCPNEDPVGSDAEPVALTPIRCKLFVRPNRGDASYSRVTFNGGADGLITDLVYTTPGPPSLNGPASAGGADDAFFNQLVNTGNSTPPIEGYLPAASGGGGGGPSVGGPAGPPAGQPSFPGGPPNAGPPAGGQGPEGDSAGGPQLPTLSPPSSSEVGSPSAVPEPQAWILIMGGLGMVGLALRRRPRGRSYSVRAAMPGAPDGGAGSKEAI